MTPELDFILDSMPKILFIIAALVALVSALFTVTRLNAVHALLYLVVTMMAISLIFFLLGASFAAALQIIVYAGAIMVLFVFVTMMLHQGETTITHESQLFQPGRSVGVVILCVILFIEVLILLGPLSHLGIDQIAQEASSTGQSTSGNIGAREVGLTLFGPYLLLVEISALLLLTALIGAFHLGRRHQEGAE